MNVLRVKKRSYQQHFEKHLMKLDLDRKWAQMIRWKTRDKSKKTLNTYMDVVEARKFFEAIKKPDFTISGQIKYYFPDNYQRHLRSLEN